MSYKIKVKVELVECNDSPENGLTQHDDGSFSQIIEEKDAISIDHCERALLSTAYPTIREAISRHLSEISKKKLSKKDNLDQ